MFDNVLFVNVLLEGLVFKRNVWRKFIFKKGEWDRQTEKVKYLPIEIINIWPNLT